MAVITYTDERGFKWALDVPPDCPVSEYSKGILLGPPMLEGLDITERQCKELNHFLVDNGFIYYTDVQGHRSEILGFITRLVGDSRRGKNLMTQLLVLYLQEEYPEKFEQ
jgi:hypothetical protein